MPSDFPPPTTAERHSFDPSLLMAASSTATADEQALQPTPSRPQTANRITVDADRQDVAAFFPGAQNFTISGGSFTSHVQQIFPQGTQFDFRTIPLGDIDLQEELGHGDWSADCGYVQRRPPGNVVWRIYSAKLEGRDMTVVVHQGDERTKEDWVNEVKKISSLRHPNLQQLYGVASSGRISAAIYHGGLVSMEHLLDHHRREPEERVKVRLQLYFELWPAFGALHTLDRTSFKLKDIVKLMLSMSFFFRTSTKKLCLVIGSASGVPQDRHYPPLPTTAPGTRRRTQRRAPSSPTLSSLTRFEPIDKLQRLVSSSARMEVGPWDRKLVPLTPSLFATTSGGLSTALACIQASKRPCKRELGAAGIWIGKHLSFPIELTYLQNGWTRRCIGPEAAGQTLEFAANGELGSSTLLSDIWLSQAGHIFNSLNIRDNLDSYIIALPPWLEVAFTVPHGLPTCYLFLCPQRQASENKASKEDIAYWSLDQLGRHRLSLQEARLRGLPDLAISRRFGKYCWSQSVYEEIRATHIAKGFTPDSQAVAQLLGHPLFELVAERKGEYFAEAWAEDDWTLANLFHETDLRRCFEEDVFRRLSSAPAEVSEDQSSLALDEPKLQPRASNWPRLPSVRMVEAVMVVLSVLVVGIELSR